MGLIPTTRWPAVKSTILEAMGKPPPLLEMYNHKPVPMQIFNLKSYFGHQIYPSQYSQSRKQPKVEDAPVLLMNAYIHWRRCSYNAVLWKVSSH